MLVKDNPKYHLTVHVSNLYNLLLKLNFDFGARVGLSM